jgi:hypothetical protein
VEQQLDGVVFGHIHQPAFSDDTPAYLDCGDWIENCTAIVEHYGQLQTALTIRWHRANCHCRGPDWASYRTAAQVAPPASTK